ncbi:MAG: hypothetical protein OXF93_15570 [Acidobacteria bacterium]|nr:hypothetical protein [Acidobacteriota bacterium]
MIQRCFVAGLTLAALVVLAPAGSYAQEEGWTVPRTADGQPDLQGVWDFRTLTPLQRPANRAEATLTAEEAAEIEARSVAAAAARRPPAGGRPAAGGAPGRARGAPRGGSRSGGALPGAAPAPARSADRR